jgi:hypothetical protein
MYYVAAPRWRLLRRATALKLRGKKLLEKHAIAPSVCKALFGGVATPHFNSASAKNAHDRANG